MEGKLFSQDFLLDGIRTTPVWEALPDEDFDAFLDNLKRICAPLTADSQLNEANTEADIIEQVLGLLGWRDLTLKQVTATSTRREDVPDFLLFPDEDAKQAARAETRNDRRYRHGIAILEAKRWMRPLDRGDATNRLDPGTLSKQILRYLSSVEVAADFPRAIPARRVWTSRPRCKRARNRSRRSSCSRAAAFTARLDIGGRCTAQEPGCRFSSQSRMRPT